MPRDRSLQDLRKVAQVQHQPQRILLRLILLPVNIRQITDRRKRIIGDAQRDNHGNGNPLPLDHLIKGFLQMMPDLGIQQHRKKQHKADHQNRERHFFPRQRPVLTRQLILPKRSDRQSREIRNKSRRAKKHHTLPAGLIIEEKASEQEHIAPDPHRSDEVQEHQRTYKACEFKRYKTHIPGTWPYRFSLRSRQSQRSFRSHLPDPPQNRYQNTPKQSAFPACCPSRQC